MTTPNVRIAMGRESLHGKIDRFFTERGFGVNPDGLRRARMREIITLEIMSDAELAHLGIGRDEILPFVFRDLLAA
ncbi:hypothetical protein [Allosediminivita pacifica]|uniref:DUF1127 domain-containing protein n=1 Tax=Allosediminivita pacifica TaxID=1267769 RepID=A0A2T6ATN3_9RHOB|nr:hypothetical protein [Allosediminivita pacifica]PTX47172.1 hypothetical protein C8N44_11357 [Allosediminivita pacifica]GGB09721.1 hypothetical protein GCM10011324_19680 [Allosediminivita pacifica]